MPVTVSVIPGVTNGFNLIDGVNGLAGLTAIAAAVELSHIALLVDHTALIQFSMMGVAWVLGFVVLNYLFGLIFLEDSGAYTLGFLLGWFEIALMLVSPEVSPWAILLTVYWPLADTKLALVRRICKKRRVFAADHLHVYQIAMRALEICGLGRNRRSRANPLTILILAPFVIAPPIAGALLWDQNFSAFLIVWPSGFRSLPAMRPHLPA